MLKIVLSLVTFVVLKIVVLSGDTPSIVVFEKFVLKIVLLLVQFFVLKVVSYLVPLFVLSTKQWHQNPHQQERHD